MARFYIKTALLKFRIAGVDMIWLFALLGL
jgi:hypothetical protein